MTVSLRARRPRPRRSAQIPWQAILDGVMLLLWAAMLLRFTLTGQIYLLLHPDFMWLSNMAMGLLTIMGLGRVWQVWQSMRSDQRQPAPRSQEHIALLPRQISSGVLLAVAVFGLLYTPRPFTSATAFQRGITDVLGQTRSRPQRFVLSGASEDRTIVDWIRTLNVFPEPTAYEGQGAEVSGFVIHMPDWPSNFFMIARFVITCCAADAYPVGLPVQLEPGTPLPEQDSWLEISGTMGTHTLDNKRQLVITSPVLTEIPQPRNPYEY